MLAAEARHVAHRLLIHGVVLFLLGLLNGAAVPYFTNPRMGLSAHLAGVQDGMVLLLFGLLWSRMALGATAERAAYVLNLFGMYGIWLALLLAAVWGTSGGTPIAGAGHHGSAVHETLVHGLLLVSSGACIGGAVLVLIGLVAGGRRSDS